MKHKEPRWHARPTCASVVRWTLRWTLRYAVRSFPESAIAHACEISGPCLTYAGKLTQYGDRMVNGHLQVKAGCRPAPLI